MKVIMKDNEVFAKAHEEYKAFTRSDDLREIYEAREKYKRDEATRLHLAEKRGIQKGKLEDARRMLEDGMDIALIAKYTGFSMEEIEGLRG